MRPKLKSALMILACLCTLSCMGIARGQKIVIEEVQAKVQPLQQGEFQIHFEFKLPEFEVDASKINIDGAVLQFNLQTESTLSKEIHLLEVLAAAENRIDPVSDLLYNSAPVTARVRSFNPGIEQVEVDITQLVDHWVHQDLENHGLILISHRRQSEKTLKTGRTVFVPNVKPSVTIFYSVME